MKDSKRINARVMVEQEHRIRSTIISVIVAGEKTVLAEMKTSDYFWLKYQKNDRYIVVYSRGCMINQIPLKLEAVYDIKNEKVVNVTRENKVVFEYMVLSKKTFELAPILEYINNSLLNIATQDETEDFKRYITGGNRNITRDEIKEYIYSNYPILCAFADYDSALTVIQYRNLVSNIGEKFSFHIMPEAFG